MLGGGDPGIAVDLVGDRDRKILHSFTVAQFLCFTVPVRSARQADGEQTDVVRARSLALKHALGGVADLARRAGSGLLHGGGERAEALVDVTAAVLDQPIGVEQEPGAGSEPSLARSASLRRPISAAAANAAMT